MENFDNKALHQSARELTDSLLSKGKPVTNIQIYEAMESRYKLVEKSPVRGTDPVNNKDDRTYNLRQKYKPYVSIAIRWIKKEIILRGFNELDVIEERKDPDDSRRRVYRYLKPGFSIFKAEPLPAADTLSQRIDLFLSNIAKKIKLSDPDYENKPVRPASIRDIKEHFKCHEESLKLICQAQIYSNFYDKLNYLDYLSENDTPDNLKEANAIIDEVVEFIDKDADPLFQANVLALLTLYSGLDNKKIDALSAKSLRIFKNNFDNLSCEDLYCLSELYLSLTLKSHKKLRRVLVLADEVLDIINTQKKLILQSKNTINAYFELGSYLVSALFIAKSYDKVMEIGSFFNDLAKETSDYRPIKLAHIYLDMCDIYAWHDHKYLEAEKYAWLGLEIYRDYPNPENKDEINTLYDLYILLADMYDMTIGAAVVSADSYTRYTPAIIKELRQKASEIESQHPEINF